MNKRQGRYEFANVSLRNLVQELPELTSLDISGTNLAGTGTYDDLKGRISLLTGSILRFLISSAALPLWWTTLGTEMFGVGDFWLETRVIIKISKIPC